MLLGVFVVGYWFWFPELQDVAHTEMRESKHTSDYKVRLPKKAQNAAGNLQVIKRLRRGTEKNGVDK